jgi:uncharacterized protein DUF6160
MMGESEKRSRLRQIILPGSLLLATPVLAELQSLTDADMAAIRGQSGITLDMDLEVAAKQLSYSDDGKAVHLENFRIGSSDSTRGSARHLVKIDIEDDSSLNLDYLVENRRIEFQNVTFGSMPGESLSGPGIGGLFFDHSLDGYLRIRPSTSGSVGATFDSSVSLTDGRLGYRTNGNEVFLDDITMNAEALGITLDVAADGLEINVPRMTGAYDVGAIRFSGNPSNHGNSVDLGSGQPLPSYGGLGGDYDLSSRLRISGGGREGEGFRIDNETTIHSANFVYTDDGNGVRLRDITGHYRIDDLRVDVAEDRLGRNALGLTLGSVDGELTIGGIGIGASGGSVGQVNLDFLFSDHLFNGRVYSNEVYIQGGGHPDAGPQGLRLAAQWSLSNADLSYAEDGNRVIFSGLQSWGQGDVTANVTRNEIRDGTRFYDGLRIGFENLQAGYRINGLRVGNEDAPLQGGTELLLALGFYPAYEFDLDGQITLGPGGAEGEGLTINSDLRIRNGRAAMIAAPYDAGEGERPQKGLWLTELAYDGHVRDMTLDVTGEGLSISKGEAWGLMDIGNLRVGGKEDGGSFGRFVFQTYETGSQMTVTPGGAGAVCAGGMGADPGACVASGGRWEDRGEQGVTIWLKQVLARAANDNRKNAFTWETNRRVSEGSRVNGTGTALVLNDIHTSDGGDFDGDGVDDNTFGIQTDLAVDVYQTRVVKKSDGPDALGVVGLRGDEKIMDPATAAGYRYVSSPDPSQIENRPLGFAVEARARFRELSVNNIDLVHPTGGPQTVVYGVEMQNFDIRANLTATPIP